MFIHPPVHSLNPREYPHPPTGNIYVYSVVATLLPPVLLLSISEGLTITPFDSVCRLCHPGSSLFPHRTVSTTPSVTPGVGGRLGGRAKTVQGAQDAPQVRRRRSDALSLGSGRQVEDGTVDGRGRPVTGPLWAPEMTLGRGGREGDSGGAGGWTGVWTGGRRGVT